MEMAKINDEYIEKVNRYEEESLTLYEKVQKRYEDIRRAERSVARLNKKRHELEFPSWVESLVKPIAERFAKDFNMDYDIYGPFGLRAQVTIYWMKDKEISITEQPTKTLSLVPLDLKNGKIGYETGRKKEGNNYPSGSIGYLNGLDLEVLPLPDSFEEIKLLIRS